MGRFKAGSAEAAASLSEGGSEEYAGEQIPFLADIIETIPPGLKLYVEIKCEKEVLPILHKLIIQSGKMSQIVIIGFDLETVAMAKELIDVPTYWLKGTEKDKETEEWIPHDPQLVQIAKNKGLDGLDVHYADVTKEFAGAVKASGQKLYVWTVDEPEEAIRLVKIPPTIWKGRALVGSSDGWVYAFEAKTGRLLWRFRAAPAEPDSLESISL